MIVDYLSIGEFSLLLIWIILDFTISSKSLTEVGEVRQRLAPRKQRVLARIIVACNTLISILHLCYCIHGIWKLGRVSVRDVFLTMSWVLVTIHAMYCMKTRVLVYFTWPLVLLCWWVFSGLIELISISAYLFDIWKKTPLPDFFPSPNIVQLTSFPLSVLICFSALCISSLQTNDPELEQSLLSNHEDCVSTRDDFYRAGIWSRLTFRWLNPVFEKAHRVQRLELFHVPKVPESESAESSFSILQESRKQKPELAASLVKAVIYTVWRPLVVNAILAGTETLLTLH